MTPNREEVGRTQFTYVDKLEEAFETILNDKELLWSFFTDMEERLCKTKGSGMDVTAKSDSFGLFNQGGQHQAVEILRRLLYTAARIGVEGFIRMVFGTSAGRIVFEAYKNKSPLPEEIAAGNGYDEIASFLRDVSERFSKKDGTRQSQSNYINWLELARAVKESEAQSGPSSEDAKHVQDDEIVYDGDAETSSSESNIENSDSEGDMKTVFCKVSVSEVADKQPEYEALVENKVCHGKGQRNSLDDKIQETSNFDQEISTVEYTPEQLNYLRLCYIVFNLVPEGLREVFKQEWDFLYKTTPLGEWKDTPMNGLDFHKMESKKGHTKNARCLATIQKGNTAEWDCTCLFFAILFSDSIGTSLSPAIRNGVADLRQVLNGAANISNGKLTDANFKSCVGKVIGALNSLSRPISLVEEVKNRTTFPTAEVDNLMSQIANLRVDLLQAKCDLQEVQNTVLKKEEEVGSLTQEKEDPADAAESYHSWAAACRKLGLHNQAREYNEKALSIRKKIYGEEHPDVAESYYSLAADCRGFWLHNQAREYDEKALSIRKKIYGEEHPDVAESYYSLAADCRKLGQHNQAKEYDEKALSIRKKIYGKEHPDAAESYHSLAADCRGLWQHNQAKEYDEKALSIRKKIFGEGYPDVAESYHSVAADCSGSWEYSQAKKYDEEALSIAESYHSLAADCRKLGQHNQAEEYDRKALRIRKQIYGEEHPDVAESYHSLAADCRRFWQFNQAKEYNEKALSIRKKIYGEEHPDVAESYHSLAADCRWLWQHNQAEEYNEKALSIIKKIYGEEHPSVAERYHSLAANWRMLGQHNQAKEYDEKALSIRKKIYGEEHPDVAEGYHSLATDCRTLGQHNQANEYDEKALSIRKKIYGKEHPDVAEGYHSRFVDCWNNWERVRRESPEH